MKTISRIPTTGWELSIMAAAAGRCDRCDAAAVASLAFMRGDGWKHFRHVPVGFFCQACLDQVTAEVA